MTLRKRQIVYPWAQPSEISALIVAVQKRPPLWDSRDSDYKLTHTKSELWVQVANELGIPDVDGFEARNKWNALRSLFKANLSRIRAKLSITGPAAETPTVSWAYFSEMTFLETGDIYQPSPTTPKMPVVKKECADNEISISNAWSENSYFKTVNENLPPVKRRRNSSESREKTQMSSPERSTSPTNIKNSRSEGLKDLAADVLTTLQSQGQNDRYSSFGELIAQNLRSLPIHHSLQLEARIMEQMYDFLSSRAELINTLTN